MAIDIVVCNYHTDSMLRDFIASVGERSFVGCTLTVVDVAVDDHTAEGTLSTLNNGNVHLTYVPVKENIGYARACNFGAQSGSNDVILLANADTVLSGGLAECYDALMANPDWGVLGPRQVDEHNRITFGGIFGPDRLPKQRGWLELDRGSYSDIRDDSLTVAGSLYFIKRSVWHELTQCDHYQAVAPGVTGAFLPTQHYFEETFCSYHARAHGYKVVYYGPVKMIHYWHKSSPLGGYAEGHFRESQAYMRQACANHNILCE